MPKRQVNMGEAYNRYHERVYEDMLKKAGKKRTKIKGISSQRYISNYNKENKDD